MPPQKLLGPCSVHQCSKNSSDFRRLTEIAYNKAKEHGALILYPNLQLYDIICFSHYISIVENYHQNNEKESEPELSSEGISLASKIQKMTDVFYQMQHKEFMDLILDPEEFNHCLAERDEDLNDFLSEIFT